MSDLLSKFQTAYSSESEEESVSVIAKVLPHPTETKPNQSAVMLGKRLGY